MYAENADAQANASCQSSQPIPSPRSSPSLQVSQQHLNYLSFFMANACDALNASMK